MKKVLLTLLTICFIVVGIGAVTQPTEVSNVNNEATITSENEDFITFQGTITWVGDVGVVLVNDLDLYNRMKGTQIRESPTNYISYGMLGNTSVILVDKVVWQEFGAPSDVSYGLFCGYMYCGQVSLTVSE